jgi:hypothetical protein
VTPAVAAGLNDGGRSMERLLARSSKVLISSIINKTRRVNRLQLSRRHLVVWSIAALILVVICALAVVIGQRIRARTERRMAIFTIRKIVTAASGTIYMEHDLELVGDNLTAGIAKQTGLSVFEYESHVKGSGVGELFGFLPMFDDKASGEGSYELGDCPQSTMIKTPLRIELKPGERSVLATCRDKSGAKVELYVYCDI